MKYFVIASQWSDAKQEQVNIIVGSFDVYHLASLFRDAYNNHFHASAFVIDANKLANSIDC